MIRLVCALVAALPVVPSALHASHVCSTSRTRSGFGADISKPATRSVGSLPCAAARRRRSRMSNATRTIFLENPELLLDAEAMPAQTRLPGTPLTPGGSALECDSSLAPASAYSHDAAAATPLRIADLQLRLIDFAVRRSQIVCASQLVRIATGTVYGTMSTGTCRDRAG